MLRLARLIAVRLGHALFVLLAVITLSFTLVHLAPGDIAETIAGTQGGATEEQLADIRSTYGLDRPFVVQLGAYIANAAQGDLGDSLFFNESVASLLLERLWPTVLLVAAALGIAIMAGMAMGIYSARRPTHASSHLVTGFALFGFSAPIFWTGIMLQLIFTSWLSLLPTFGMRSVAITDSGVLAAWWDVFKHLILPALSLGFFYVAQYSRISRASMLEILGADYVRTARAKGLSERIVIYKHALRNAVIPVVTIAGLQFAAVLSGAILVESVFEWPGMGRLAFEAVLRRDTPVLLGTLVLATVIVIIANMLTDLSYRLIDPRIRFSSDT